MRRRKKVKKLIWVSLMILIFLVLYGVDCNRVFAQEDINTTYVLTHLENAAEKMDNESLGMGGVYAASPNFTSGNPASLANIKEFSVLDTYSQTRTSLFTVKGNMFRLYGKLGVVGIMAGTNTSSISSFNLNGSTIYGNERSTVFGFGLPVMKNVYFGANFAPEISTDFNIRTTAMIAPFPIPSDVNIALRSGVVSGESFGLLYSKDKFHAGWDYRQYCENTWNNTAFTLAFGFGIVNQNNEESFDSKRYQFGLRVDDIIPKVDLAVGYYDSRFKSANPNGSEFNYNKMQYGLNFKFRPNVHFQFGLNDGEPTLGISLIRKFTIVEEGKEKEIGDLSLQVSYARNQFKKLLEANPAITDKGHDSLNVGVQWRF